MSYQRTMRFSIHLMTRPTGEHVSNFPFSRQKTTTAKRRGRHANRLIRTGLEKGFASGISKPYCIIQKGKNESDQVNRTSSARDETGTSFLEFRFKMDECRFRAAAPQVRPFDRATRRFAWGRLCPAGFSARHFSTR